MGSQANAFFAVPQERHAMLVAPERDELARQEFVRSFKSYIQSGIVPGVHATYHQEVKPDFERQQRRPPRDRHEIRRIMVEHPLFQMYASMQRVSQELLWDTVLDSVERELPRLMEQVAHPGARVGSLALDAGVQPPKYVAGVDIHCMPGGYCADAGPTDVTAGALYDRGVYLYALGMMGPRNDDIGASAAKFVRERYPHFKPRRILDLGCTVGHSTLPFVDAFPAAEVHAIDVGPALLRYAHLRAESLGKKVHFAQMDATATRFPDGHFDLVTSSILFHETSAKALPAILRECYRLLAPGGLAVHGDLPPFWAMDEFNQFMLDCETYYNNEPYWGAMRDVDQVAQSIAAGFAPANVEFRMAPLGLPRGRGARARFRGRRIRPRQRLAGARMPQVKVKRSVKGRRPQFHTHSSTDKLHGMIMAMATEMAVLYERIDTMERIANAKGIMLRAELEEYRPEPAVQAERERWRQRFLERLFYLYREELDDRLGSESDASYAQFLKEIS